MANRFLAKTRLNAAEKEVYDYVVARTGGDPKKALRIAIMRLGKDLYEQEQAALTPEEKPNEEAPTEESPVNPKGDGTPDSSGEEPAEQTDDAPGDGS